VKVLSVLRSGGDYRPEHVRRLRDQVAAFLPGAAFLCLSDAPIEGVETEPLRHDWPGWWAKMEIFAPWREGDALYLDLDSSIVGDLKPLAKIGGLTIMRDVYRPAGLQSAAIYLPAEERAEVWDLFAEDPQRWIGVHARGGDQAFLERLWLRRARRWQDELPGHVVSFKADVLPSGRIPAGARLVVFHGKPRPWEAGWA